MSVHYGTLNRRWLNNVLWHVSWPQVWTTSLCAKLGLDVNSYRLGQFEIRGDHPGRRTLLEENTLKERVLVSKHQALVGGGAVSRLKIMEVRFMDSDGLFELLYVFGAAFSKGGLSLSVPLLSLLGCCVDLGVRY